MTKPIIFSVEHRHDPSCGNVPDWTTSKQQSDERRYYFENSFGEQWIASASPTLLRVAGGDCSWTTVEFVNPDYVQIARQVSTGAIVGGFFPSLKSYILSTNECLWLLAVCAAASHQVTHLVTQGRGSLPVLRQEEVESLMAPFNAAMKKYKP